jgi:hypothetical protein
MLKYAALGASQSLAPRRSRIEEQPHATGVTWRTWKLTPCSRMQGKSCTCRSRSRERACRQREAKVRRQLRDKDVVCGVRSKLEINPMHSNASAIVRVPITRARTVRVISREWRARRSVEQAPAKDGDGKPWNNPMQRRRHRRPWNNPMQRAGSKNGGTTPCKASRVGARSRIAEQPHAKETRSVAPDEASAAGLPPRARAPRRYRCTS